MVDIVDPKIRKELEEQDALNAKKYNIDTSDPDYIAAQKRGRGEDPELEEQIRKSREESARQRAVEQTRQIQEAARQKQELDQLREDEARRGEGGSDQQRAIDFRNQQRQDAGLTDQGPTEKQDLGSQIAQGAEAVGGATEKAGQVAEAGGKGMQAAGKGIETAAKASEPALREGTGVVGGAIGAGVGAIGGAIAGEGVGAIPGARAGWQAGQQAGRAVGEGVSKAGQVVGKGMEEGGKGLEELGKGAKQTGGQIKGFGSNLSGGMGGVGMGGEGVGMPGLGGQSGPVGANQFQQQMAQARAMAANVAGDAINNIRRGDIKGAMAAGMKAAQAAGEMAGQMATGRILQFMWTNFYYVLPIFYINFHFVMRYIAKVNAFCRLGQEWLMKGGGGKTGAVQSKISNIASKAKLGGQGGTSTGGSNGAGQKQPPQPDLEKGLGNIQETVTDAPNLILEIAEIIALMLCNAIIVFLLAIIFLIIYTLISPCEASVVILGGSALRNILETLGIFNICH